MSRKTYDPTVSVRFPPEVHRRLEKQAAKKKIRLSEEIRFQVEKVMPMKPEIETVLRDLAERVEGSIGEVLEILVLSHLTRGASRNIVFGKTVCPEFRRTTETGELMPAGIPLGKLLMLHYRSEYQRMKESDSPTLEQLKQQNELLDHFAENLKTIRRVFKSTLEFLEQSTLMNQPKGSAVKESLKIQLQVIENMRGLAQYVN